MKKFPILELLIIVALAVLLYILIYPGYVQNRDMNNKYDVISNMYSLRASYEQYSTLDRIGELATEPAPEMIEYLNSFNAVNPFTAKAYEITDVQFYSLMNPLEINDNTLSGKHGTQRGSPGTFAIGVFQPDRETYDELMAKEKLTRDEKKALESLNMEVTKYTVIGFGKDSIPVTLEDQTSKKIEVYFLQGNKTSID